ncbi:hypothetical protein [Barnesiella sp. An55]|uniref:hypothetical protein n=1 Tax=Barnesiella sp. An55 TaxID=1965646 RepID=UPI000B3AD604|nr:hypothetical protein [Barnesiella sp. An55]OUN73659.1 hypothetical protein B5G10_03605 [Barnesiella sp. An55]
MKRKNIIILLCCLWIISIIVIFFGVYKYIDQKKIRLRYELRTNIQSLFQGQSSGDAFVDNEDGLFYAKYCDYPVRHYKKVTKPLRPKKNKTSIAIDPEIEERIIDEWNQDYGDIALLYELNWGDDYPNQNDEGWNIIRVYCGGLNEEFIRTNTIFPYKVGLKNTEWGNFYTVEQAVSEAYDFYTTNPKSSYTNKFRQGNVNELWNKIYQFSNENEFFSIEESMRNGWTAGKPIYIPKNKSYDEAQRVMPYENGWMHNGYYRVYIAATQERVFGIKEQEWAVSANRNQLLLWWCVGVSLLFLLLIAPFTIRQIKSHKKKSETIYQRLVRLCNPKEFIDNYDKNKVERANLIYKRLLDTSPDDKDALMSILSLASSELGINFIDKDEIKELKEKVNPKRFLNPYNAEKVSLANKLYAILNKDDISYSEVIEVKEKLKNL